MPVATKSGGTRTGPPPLRRSIGGVAALGVATSLLLTGCGDMDPDDFKDFIDAAQEAAEGDGPGKKDQEAKEDKFEQEMSRARDKWGTRPPPPAIKPAGKGIEETTVTPDGTRSAREQKYYPADQRDALKEHYTQQYGDSPTREDKRTVTWSNGDSKTSMTDNFDDTVTIESTWYKP
jgi:hypothetical protein